MVYWARMVSGMSSEFASFYVTDQFIGTCCATKVEDRRVIIVDPFFMRQCAETVCDRLLATRREAYSGLSPKSNWRLDGAQARMSREDVAGIEWLLAESVAFHEWAHHAFRHTETTNQTTTQSDSVFNELAADAYAAYLTGSRHVQSTPKGVVRTPSVAQEVVIEFFCSISGIYDTSHPDAMKRMTLVRDFFSRGLRDGVPPGAEHLPSVDDVRRYLGE